jgi:hypothetical protein
MARQAGVSDRQTIAALAQLVDELIEKCADLELLAPKRYRCADGSILSFNVPPDLVPIEDLDGGFSKGNT